MIYIVFILNWINLLHEFLNSGAYMVDLSNELINQLYESSTVAQLIEINLLLRIPFAS